LTPEVEQLLSKAYIRLLTHLVEAFAEAMPAQQVETLLRRAGLRDSLARYLTANDLPGRLGLV
jgi:hypothetical protein